MVNCLSDGKLKLLLVAAFKIVSMNLRVTAIYRLMIRSPFYLDCLVSFTMFPPVCEMICLYGTINV